MRSHSVRSRCFLLLVYTAALCGCRKPAAAPAGPAPKSPPIAEISRRPTCALTAARPLAWKYLENGSGRETTQPREFYSLHIGVFDDGTIIWSQSPKRLGAPYLMAKLTPDAFKTLKSALADDVSPPLPDDIFRSFGPDSSLLVIGYELDHRRRMELASWHEGVENNSQVVVSQDGIELLEGRDRNAALARRSPAYRRFLDRWQRLTLVLERAVPPTGDTIDPTQISWK